MNIEKTYKKKYRCKEQHEKKTEQQQTGRKLTDAQLSELNDKKRKGEIQKQGIGFVEENGTEKSQRQVKPRPYPGFSKAAKQKKYGEGKTVEQQIAKQELKQVSSSQGNEQYEEEERGQRRCNGGCKRRARRGMRGRKYQRSRSRSNSSSSQSSSSEKEEEQVCPLIRRKHNRKEIMPRIINNQQLKQFFTSRKIKPEPQQRISCLLASRLTEPIQFNINTLLYCIQQLQQHGKTEHLPYHKVIRVLLKHNLQLELAWPNVEHVQNKRIQRHIADQKFREMYGEEAVPLRKKELMELDLNEWIFLMDGNNLLPTEKHLRYFFKGSQKDKAQAQVRLRWYLSNCMPHYSLRLFYDEQYPVEDYLYHMSKLIPKDHQGLFTSVPVIYGQGKKADDRIVETVLNIKKTMPQKKILLVSADRELHQRCNQNGPINHTSGQFLFKYLRFLIFKRFNGVKDKQSKGDRKVIRKILKYQ